MALAMLSKTSRFAYCHLWRQCFRSAY